MIEINQKEVLRYMGFKYGEEPGAELKQRISECEQELQKAITPRHVYQKFDLKTEHNMLHFAGLSVDSKALRKNLSDCHAVYLFAATIGVGADRLIARGQIRRMSDAVIYQAASAALIEAYCDSVNQQIRELEEQNGCRLRPRFSPGYGDLPLSLQKSFTELLQTSRTIGLTLTDTLLMMPSKSVTAIIGVTNSQLECHLQGCEVCNKRTDCAYSRA